MRNSVGRGDGHRSRKRKKTSDHNRASHGGDTDLGSIESWNGERGTKCQASWGACLPGCLCEGTHHICSYSYISRILFLRLILPFNEPINAFVLRLPKASLVPLSPSIHRLTLCSSQCRSGEVNVTPSQGVCMHCSLCRATAAWRRVGSQ